MIPDDAVTRLERVIAGGRASVTIEGVSNPPPLVQRWLVDITAGDVGASGAAPSLMEAIEEAILDLDRVVGDAER